MAVQEVQRLTNVLPINLQHATLKEVDMEGFRIPAGTPILHQISSVLADPRHFPDPDRFDPLRFLDENANRLRSLDPRSPSQARAGCGLQEGGRVRAVRDREAAVRRGEPRPDEPLPRLRLPPPQLRLRAYPRSGLRLSIKARCGKEAVDAGKPLPTLLPQFKFTRSPYQYRCVVNRRRRARQ